MNQIEVKNVSKEYVEGGVVTPVLHQVSLTLSKGETVAIWGSSGAGKSTLLHILGGLDLPTSGEVYFEGRDIRRFKEAELAAFRNERVGFVFQFHHLLQDFSALENVMMPLLIRGEGRGLAQERARALLERVGLGHREDHLPSELSGGEQQRVALSRALVGAPSVVLADEPTGNLDEENGQKVFDLLLSLNEELSTTLVVVTHNAILSRRLGRTIHLVDGKIETNP